MARCVLILLLPTLLSLSLLADAGYNLVQPSEQEVDNPLVLHDAFEQNPLRLPSEKKNETMKDVPLLVRRPWDRYEVPNANPGKYRPRAETGESRFEPRERAFERTGKRFPAREQNHPHGYGQDEWEWRFPKAEEHKRGRYERHEYPHGSEKKFEHFWGDGPREDHLRFRPQFSRPSFSPSSEEESVSSFGSFPGELRHRPENEESGFELRERAFKPFGKGFPEREHNYPRRHGQGGWEWEFPRRVYHSHGRYERPEYPHGGEMKFRHFWGHGRRGEHYHFRPQFPRPSPFPCSGEHGKEAISASEISFPGEFRPRYEKKKPGFEPQERAFEHIGNGFPEREHNYPHGHVQGQWKWEFPNGEEHKHGRHARHEYLHGGEMKFRRFRGDGPRGDHFHFRPQFPRPSSFPSSGSPVKETISSAFGSFHGEVRPQAGNEKSGFQPRERVFEHIVGKPGFPHRQHSHGQQSFVDGDEHKHEGHERHEDQPALWTDWLKALFPGH